MNNLLAKSLKKSGFSETVIKSIIWKSIVDIFMEEKNIDISRYLISINKKGDTIFIKTNKPLINQEIQIFEKKIIERTKDKLKKIGLNYKKTEIRYI